MKTPRSRIAQAIAEKLLAGDDGAALSKQVAAYLLQERRVGEVDSLVRDIQAEWAKAGYVEVLATSAYPLSEAVKAEIAARIKQVYPNAAQIAITEIHDEAVIGGVRLNLADQQLDLSVKAKLNKFKQLTTAGKE
jgi:F-type H+-transporting ATPase subunit delta